MSFIKLCLRWVLSKLKMFNCKKFCIYLILETGATDDFLYVFKGDRLARWILISLTWKRRKLYIDVSFFFLMCWSIFQLYAVLKAVKKVHVNIIGHIQEMHLTRYWIIRNDNWILRTLKNCDKINLLNGHTSFNCKNGHF